MSYCIATTQLLLSVARRCPSRCPPQPATTPADFGSAAPVNLGSQAQDAPLPFRWAAPELLRARRDRRSLPWCAAISSHLLLAVNSLFCRQNITRAVTASVLVSTLRL